MSDKREKIIESATEMIRFGGYNTFSFREIADAVGVKSSSVHHYFRRKEDLAAEVAQRYADAFFTGLGAASQPDESPLAALKRYGSGFIGAYQSSGKACLCGILSHESPALPEMVKEHISAFVDRNVAWLSEALSTGPGALESEVAAERARIYYAGLSGAMGVAALKGESAWISEVLEALVESFE